MMALEQLLIFSQKEDVKVFLTRSFLEFVKVLPEEAGAELDEKTSWLSWDIGNKKKITTLVLKFTFAYHSICCLFYGIHPPTQAG
jgi:hypothetical protein